MSDIRRSLEDTELLMLRRYEDAHRQGDMVELAHLDAALGVVRDLQRENDS
jgi:hypothetical protein